MSLKTQSAPEVSSVVRSIRFTPGLYGKLEQLAQRKEFKGNVTQVVITACRQYITAQEDVIGSRAHFQKTFRERIDELEAKQAQDIVELTRTVEQQLSHLYKALALKSFTSDTTSDTTELARTDLSLITLELHTILHLLTFAFSKMLPRFDAADKTVSDASKLLNNQVTQAQRERNVYDVILRAAQHLITPMPFDEKDLLPDNKK